MLARLRSTLARWGRHRTCGARVRSLCPTSSRAAEKLPSTEAGARNRVGRRPQGRPRHEEGTRRGCQRS
eukprot:scaffold2051_cov389-Prasinococcus_capsulatus_cf.AAC.11